MLFACVSQVCPAPTPSVSATMVQRWTTRIVILWPDQSPLTSSAVERNVLHGTEPCAIVLWSQMNYSEILEVQENRRSQSRSLEHLLMSVSINMMSCMLEQCKDGDALCIYFVFQVCFMFTFCSWSLTATATPDLNYHPFIFQTWWISFHLLLSKGGVHPGQVLRVYPAWTLLQTHTFTPCGKWAFHISVKYLPLVMTVVMVVVLILPV